MRMDDDLNMTINRTVSLTNLSTERFFWIILPFGSSFNCLNSQRKFPNPWNFRFLLEITKFNCQDVNLGLKKKHLTNISEARDRMFTRYKPCRNILSDSRSNVSCPVDAESSNYHTTSSSPTSRMNTHAFKTLLLKIKIINKLKIILNQNILKQKCKIMPFHWSACLFLLLTYTLSLLFLPLFLLSKRTSRTKQETKKRLPFTEKVTRKHVYFIPLYFILHFHFHFH